VDAEAFALAASGRAREWGESELRGTIALGGELHDPAAEVADAVEQDEHVFLHRFRSLDAAAERNVLRLCGN